MDDKLTLDELTATDDPQAWAVELAKHVADNQDAMDLETLVKWFEFAMTTAKAFQWREDQRDVIGYQEMLGHVLEAVGGKVEVTKEQLTRGHPKGRQINVDDVVERDVFVFRLEDPK